jgi:hypothetical protein
MLRAMERVRPPAFLFDVCFFFGFNAYYARSTIAPKNNAYEFIADCHRIEGNAGVACL